MSLRNLPYVINIEYSENVQHHHLFKTRTAHLHADALVRYEIVASGLQYVFANDAEREPDLLAVAASCRASLGRHMYVCGVDKLVRCRNTSRVRITNLDGEKPVFMV